MPETIISSPALIAYSPKLKASKFRASVDPLVNIISFDDFALIKALSFSRAPSYKSVARPLSVCTPRWTLELSCK